MSLQTVLAFATAICLVLSPGVSAQDDLRRQFGTRSVPAANALAEGIRAVQEKRYADGFKALDEALGHDDQLDLGYYWKAAAYVETGDVEQAIATYKHLIEMGQRNRRSKNTVANTVVDACINLALVYAKLEDNDNSVRWFSKAVLLDPQDLNHLRWKAYRNMAINLRNQGQNLSAAMCAIRAYAANPERVELDMIRQFLGAAEQDEVGKILYLGDETPTVAPRADKTNLVEVELAEKISSKVSQLLLDEQNNRVVAVITDGLLLIDPQANNAAQHVKIGGQILTATAVGGHAYVSTAAPATIKKIDPVAGKIAQSWDLDVTPPQSLAVVPSSDSAFFPVKQIIHRFDLKSGTITPTDFSATAVATDPTQRYCYAYVREERNAPTGHFIINGRPVLIRSSRMDWQQTAIFQLAVSGQELLLASLRMNAASNCRLLHISPDGIWVVPVGGGGWRPQTDVPRKGYGTAAFSAANLATVQGFFETDAYPISAAISPATQQIAAIREKDAKIYDLANPNTAFKIEGPFTSAATWSADGEYLYLAGATGLRVFKNTRSDAEIAAADKWIEALAARVPAVASGPQSGVAIEPLKEFASFTVKKDRASIVALIKKVLKEGSSSKPIEWTRYAPLHADEASSTYLKKAYHEVSTNTDTGIHLFRLKKLETQMPDHPGLEFLIGKCQLLTQQNAAGQEQLIAAIQHDQGATNLTLESLRALADMYFREGDGQSAAYCFAHVLLLDKLNSALLREGERYFKLAGLEKEYQPLIAEAKQHQVAAPHSRSASPKLPTLTFSTDKKSLSAKEIFAKSAASVVMVRIRTGSGSGVCVGRPGLILTNYHVIKDAPSEIYIIPYRINDGKLDKLKYVRAQIVFQSPKDDIAVLQAEKPPATLVPLFLSTAQAAPGERVYALGSPGLAATVLEQSFSEGIISATRREVEGQPFIQHTAAVNPGNSGGPLLNEYGEVAGIVTLKAGLENVSFAVPADKLREFFPRAPEPAEEEPTFAP